jgi:hypothetical protein
VGYFLTVTNKRESKGFFERLTRAAPPVNALPGTLDLAAVQHLGHTTGGYFADLKINEVSTAGIWGTADIVDSDEWGRYSEVGDISALYMRVASRAGTERSVQVTKDRLVLLMQHMSERDNLDFVAHLNELFDNLDGSS